MHMLKEPVKLDMAVVACICKLVIIMTIVNRLSK